MQMFGYFTPSIEFNLKSLLRIIMKKALMDFKIDFSQNYGKFSLQQTCDQLSFRSQVSSTFRPQKKSFDTKPQLLFGLYLPFTQSFEHQKVGEL